MGLVLSFMLPDMLCWRKRRLCVTETMHLDLILSLLPRMTRIISDGHIVAIDRMLNGMVSRKNIGKTVEDRTPRPAMQTVLFTVSA